MHFDVASNVGAVTRAVVDRDHEGKPARVVLASRSYATGIDDAWDALTSAERIPRWFLPIEGDLKLGGRYQLKGNAGGTIMECEPPRRLALSWEFAGGTSWVFVTLTEEGPDSTRLELEHVAHKDEEFVKFWDQFGPGAVGVGWDLTLLGFGAHVEQGFAVDHEEAEAWALSENGKDYATQSSDRWCAASVALGTEPGQARAAADRTTAFYTGAPPPGTED